MNFHSIMVSTHLVILFLLICKTSADSESGGEQGDPELLTKLLDTLGKLDHDTDVSSIRKSLEVAEYATSTTTTAATTTTPKPTNPTTTTESPFLKIKRPSKFYTGYGKPSNLDEAIAYFDRSLKEVQNELGSGDVNATNEGIKIRRSDYHHHHLHPPVGSLLWSTAQAVWDVSRPVLRWTTVGRNIAFARNTVSLPLRTLGAIRHRFQDLYHHPNGHGYDRRHRSLFHHDHHDHHHHGHGHGWKDSVVYVKYEPDNSLFKSWLRYLYRAIRPAAISKIYLKRHLLRIKLRYLYLALYRAVTTKLRLLRNKLRPNVVVVKAPHHGWRDHSYDHHHYHGLEDCSHGHHHDHHHGLVVLKETGIVKAPNHHHPGWLWGWPTPPPPPPPPPPPKPIYEPSRLPTYTDITYGPPVQTSYDPYSNYYANSKSSNEMPAPKSGYGPPSPPPPLESYGHPANKPVAYNQENTYKNYQSPTSSWQMALEHMSAQGSAKRETSASTDIDAPSYSKYLKDLGINPSTLAKLNPLPFESSVAGPGSPDLRQLEEKTNMKNSENVPYLLSNDEDDAARKYDNENDKTNRDVYYW